MLLSCYYVALGAVRGNPRWCGATLDAHPTYGTRKILSVQGSFTLVPEGKPLTSTYLPSLSNGLKTYPGLPGTNFPVGNVVDGAAPEDETLVCDCTGSWRDVTEVPLDLRPWLRSASPRGCCCEAEAVSGGIGWPGFVTSDAVSVPTMVDDSSPRFRVA